MQQVLPRGVTRARVHDGLGGLVSESGAGAEATTATRELGYDGDGHPVSRTDAAGTTTFTYNLIGAPETVADR